MQLYFFRGEAPNFGDELSGWLMPRMFPGMFDEPDGRLFLGIGSILFDHHPDDLLKVVFGSGYGGYTPVPAIDERWKFYCVRGPRTAMACGLDAKLAASDPAILISDYWRRSPAKIHRVSFMPHFRSIPLGQWQAACRLAGVHFIDPRAPVEVVLSEICESELLITEAMHGAIVADALRTPWVPVAPFNPINEPKWRDWAETVDVDLKFYRLLPSSVQEASLRVRGREVHALKSVSRNVSRLTMDAPFIAVAAASLKTASRQAPQLSSDRSLDRAKDRLNGFARQVRADFA